MTKQCLIRQPAGLGDIFFCQKIAKKIVEKYDIDVIWPVIPEFEWVSDYLIGDRISYVSLNSDYKGKALYNTPCNVIVDNDSLLYIPLQHADQHPYDDSIMVSKYKSVSLSHIDWAKFFQFNRNYQREDKLFYDILKLTDNDKYIFVNKNYGSPPNSVPCKYINLNTNLKIINMKFIEGVNLLDWCKVLEQAVQIHTTETSLSYVIESMPKCKGLNMYPRDCSSRFSHVTGLFQHEWVYHV